MVAKEQQLVINYLVCVSMEVQARKLQWGAEVLYYLT